MIDFKQRAVGVGQLLGEGEGSRKGAAGMTFPDLLGQNVDEADLFPDRALVERVGREVAIEVAGAQVGDHFRGRHDTDLDVDVGIQAEFGHIVAQQEVVHRIFERHAEGEALPLLGIALVLVLVVQHDRLAVDVFDGGHDVGGRCRSGAERHGQRHRGQHVAGVILAGSATCRGQRPSRRS
jgi:hypothetical protein